MVQALAKFFSPLFGVAIDPLNEIVVGPRPDIGLYFAALTFINPMDEVLMIEPYFDCYKRVTDVNGGIPVYVTLKTTNNDASNSAVWKLDPNELEAAFNNKTKPIFINTPHNPIKSFRLVQPERFFHGVNLP